MSTILGIDPGACIEFTGYINRHGYGVKRVGRKTELAHRVAYVAAHGGIPDGLVLDHLCRNRKCVNPAHLEAVSNRENILRGVGRAARQARQTHCKNGHPFDAANTYWYPKRNKRACRICLAAYSAAYKPGRKHQKAVIS